MSMTKYHALQWHTPLCHYVVHGLPCSMNNYYSSWLQWGISQPIYAYSIAMVTRFIVYPQHSFSSCRLMSDFIMGLRSSSCSIFITACFMSHCSAKKGQTYMQTQFVCFSIPYDKISWSGNNDFMLSQWQSLHQNPSVYSPFWAKRS